MPGRGWRCLSVTALPAELPLAPHCQRHQELGSTAQAAQWGMQHRPVHGAAALPMALV